MQIRGFLAGLVLCALPQMAQARVDSSSADAMILSGERVVSATPERVFAALGQIERWWSDDHSYSGNAANLRMPLEAGACFCERWPAGSVRHGTVVMVMPNRQVRVDAALGPLQELGATGVLTFSLKPTAAGTQIALTYRVSGDGTSALTRLAPAVNTVLDEQLGRLATLVEQGELQN